MLAIIVFHDYVNSWLDHMEGIAQNKYQICLAQRLGDKSVDS